MKRGSFWNRAVAAFVNDASMMEGTCCKGLNPIVQVYISLKILSRRENLKQAYLASEAALAAFASFAITFMAQNIV